MSELGPTSKILLDVIEESHDYIVLSETIAEATKRSQPHTHDWWFRRLAALAIEDQIEAKVYREGDHLSIKFRRKKEDEG